MQKAGHRRGTTSTETYAQSSHPAFASRGLQPVQRFHFVAIGKVPYFGGRKVFATRGYIGDRAVGDDCHAFDLLVVLTDKVQVRGESPEALPAGKFLGMNQHAVQFGVLSEIGIDRNAETAEILFAERRVGLEYQNAFWLHYRVVEHGILHGWTCVG